MLTEQSESKLNTSNKCTSCKEDLVAERYVSCARCADGYHHKCVEDNFDIIQGNWLCAECKVNKSSSDFSVVAQNTAGASVEAIKSDVEAYLRRQANKAADVNSSTTAQTEELRRLLRTQHQQLIEMQCAQKENDEKFQQQIAELQNSHISDIQRIRDAALEGIETAQAEAQNAIGVFNSRTSGLEEKLKLASERRLTKNQQLAHIKHMLEQLSVSPSCEKRDLIVPSAPPLEDKREEKEKKFRSEDTDSYLQNSSFIDVGHRDPVSEGFDRLSIAMNRQYLQKIPSFDGDEREWAVFEAVYNATTTSGRYTDAENVTRLREALKPPALDLVLDLVLFSTDAGQIMEELKEAYGRPVRLMTRMMNDLIVHPTLRNQPEEKLREFATKVKTFVATVKSLKRHADLHNVYAVECLSLKLRGHHYKDWTKKKRTYPDADLQMFADFLSEKVKEIPPDIEGATMQPKVKSLQPATQSRLQTARGMSPSGDNKIY